MTAHVIDPVNRRCAACYVPSWAVDDRLAPTDCAQWPCGCRPAAIVEALRSGCSNPTCPHVKRP